VNKTSFSGVIKRKGDFIMEELLEWMDYIEDSRQQAKV